MKSKIYIFLVLLVIGCTNSENSKIDLERLKVVEELLTDDINNNKIPGAVVLVGNEKGIVYQKAFGVKNSIYNKINPFNAYFIYPFIILNKSFNKFTNKLFIS